MQRAPLLSLARIGNRRFEAPVPDDEPAEEVLSRTLPGPSGRRAPAPVRALELKYVVAAPESGARRPALLLRAVPDSGQPDCLELLSPVLADAVPALWGLPDEALFWVLCWLLEHRAAGGPGRGNGSAMDTGHPGAAGRGEGASRG